MLQDLHISTFRCFKLVTVPLRPLTVLIGKNDTGKSSFLRAIGLLGGLYGREPAADGWRGGTEFTILGHWGQTPVRCEGSGGNQKQALLNPVRSYFLPNTGPHMLCKGMKGVPELGSLGQNVPALIDYFLRTDRKRFDSYVETLKSRIPGLEDVLVETPDANTRELELEIEGGFKIPASQASAGVRLLLFFVALAHHPAPPKVVLIEEPENGLHPKRLGYIVKLLRGLTTGNFGSHEASQKTQVIVTTHSPYLLDEIDMDTDQVLVFRREEDGSRSAKAADPERLKNFLDEFKLGEVWFNQDEEGLLPRPPGSKAKQVG